MTLTERTIEQKFIQKLIDLKYTHRPDIHDRRIARKKISVKNSSN